MDTATMGYQFLELIGISGEVSVDSITELGISETYGKKLITRLKEEKLIKTHYKDKLRGYRLTKKGKQLLLEQNPERFSFYLTGNTDTNQPRSELPRRRRLQQASKIYTLFKNAGIKIFRDEKTFLFQSSMPKQERLRLPAFYYSRELKELGAETIKINNSRMMGVLLTKCAIYVVYYTGDSLMKWEYRTELRVRTLLSYHMLQGVLSKYYPSNTPIAALMIGTGMEVSKKMLTSTGGYEKRYFCLDTSFEHFYYLPDSSVGKSLLKLFYSSKISKELRTLLLSDLQPPCFEDEFEYDARLEGVPVLLCYSFDLVKIARFLTNLSLYQKKGTLICFDFQKEVLQQYYGEYAMFTTIDLEKFKRRFLNETC